MLNPTVQQSSNMPSLVDKCWSLPSFWQTSASSLNLTQAQYIWSQIAATQIPALGKKYIITATRNHGLIKKHLKETRFLSNIVSIFCLFIFVKDN